MKKVILLCALLIGAITSQAQKRVLVFSLTRGFHHNSIKEGNQFFLDLGKKEGFAVDTTTNATKFNEENLKKYNAVVWLSTTGDVLNPAQQADFERYIQAGGGYVGIHAASDTEYNWSWYNDLMGGYFASHPGGKVSNVQKGKMITLDKTFPASAHFPETFEKTDEFYDFKSLKKDILKFIVRVDESSYQMGKMGDFHPMAWYHEFDGGKAFYSNYGHTPETFTEPLITEHFWQGLKWAMAEKLDYSKAKSQRAPEENRFERTILVNNLDEPTELATMPNGKVIFVERKGLIKVWNPTTNKVKIVGKMPVYTKFEYGLMGVGVDPNFAANNWVYFYYSPNESREVTKDNFLSRFDYDNQKDTIVFASEKVVLRVGVKRDECCHTGGSIDWDGKGNLFLSTGDDTNPFASDGYAPIDFQPGRAGWDALRSSGNTNDLRGKVMRITPQPDGTYKIPEGNLFAASDKTRPEIYTMGHRNPYRIAVDKRNGYLYWGDVGPDAGKGNDKRGPEGIVEFNQARKPGFFGWPIFTGPNFAYNHYDFAKKESGEKYDALKPINDSPNNTGLTELPPAQKAWIYYGYGDSKLYPEFGKGGCNPMAGPVYYSEDYDKNPKKLPSYFDGKFFAYEWMRDWIYLVSMDKEGNYTGMERFMPNTKFYHPMDMAFSKDGRLFVLDYGMNWFAQNEEATLSVIEYNAGNRKPVVFAKADKKAGAAPLTVAFSSEGTIDYDKDVLKYAWNFGKGIPVSTQPNPKITFTKAGEYNVVLTVSDAAGNKSNQSMIIKVGNAEPKVSIAVKNNKSFFFDDEKIDYEVKVSDKEDGTIAKGIDAGDVVVNINYLEGYDKTMIEQGHKENMNFAAGKRLIDLSDCKACHAIDKKSIGPAYIDVAKKYRRGQTVINQLAEKVIKGGGGVWGEQAMAAHPQVSLSDARDMVDYILSLNDTKKASQPIKGVYETVAHKGKKAGAYIIQATYTDKGGKAVGPLTNTESVALRSSNLKATSYDEGKGVSKFNVEALGGEVVLANENEGYIVFKNIDMTGVKNIVVNAFSQKGQSVGGDISIHSGSVSGPLLGFMKVGETFMGALRIQTNVTGQQDIYLVFKNPKAEGKPFFGLNTIDFLNK
ncbi:ThuA domain-containing protein [Emticicia sp. SJ17W-69]|uniref:ThuA domain-containing protein n=1 Tax=Emticicia sp. SJ17W-69 TaxID=3421657 RepID=UPI003EBAEE48